MAWSSAGCLPSLPLCNLLQSSRRAGWDRCYLSHWWKMHRSYSTSSQTSPCPDDPDLEQLSSHAASFTRLLIHPSRVSRKVTPGRKLEPSRKSGLELPSLQPLVWVLGALPC